MSPAVELNLFLLEPGFLCSYLPQSDEQRDGCLGLVPWHHLHSLKNRTSVDHNLHFSQGI